MFRLRKRPPDSGHRRRRRPGERGAIAIEVALVAPVLLLCLVAATDLGRALAERARLESAAGAGAMFGAKSAANTTNTTGIAGAARSDAGDTNNTLSVSSNAYCGCADGSVIACSGSCGASPPRQYVSVTVGSDFKPLFPYYSSSTIHLSASAVVRAQ